MFQTIHPQKRNQNLLPWLMLVISCTVQVYGQHKKSQTVTPDDMQFMHDITGAVVESSRVYPGQSLPENIERFGPNTSGITLIRPGGRSNYPAFWIRDYAMSLESGFISLQEQKDMLLFTASRQADQSIILPSGSMVPLGAIPDHITFKDGLPIYFPGTIDDFKGQGDHRWKLPPFGDQFFFIHMAWYYVQQSDEKDLLYQEINGKTLLDRLLLAFDMVPTLPKGVLVAVNDNFITTDFGFRDVIGMTGELCFGSLLKFRAAQELAALLERLDDPTKKERFDRLAAEIKKAIPPTFQDDRGMLRASTGLSRQPDVWATAFAVYLGALSGQEAIKASAFLTKAYQKGTLAMEGNIRHILTTDDFSKTSAWEKASAKINTYQNGAYWGTPTGWVVYAIDQHDPKAAMALAKEYIDHLRSTDFRKGNDFGGPYECIFTPDHYKQNPVYMTSVTIPFAVFNELGYGKK